MGGFHKNLTGRQSALIAGVGLLLVGAGLAFYFAWINGWLTKSQQAQEDAARIRVVETRLRPPATDGLTLFSNSTAIRSVADFQGNRYFATPGGLIAVNASGSEERYSTLEGLPENDLTSLATFRERLFVGTATSGLLAFDGESFTRYSFEQPRALSISVLVSTDNELLIGTFDQGIFEYDGNTFTRRFNSAQGADFKKVTSLLPFESRLYVGTQDKGLFVWREAVIDHIGTDRGLPSPRVTGLQEIPPRLAGVGSIAVATDFGLVALDEDDQVKPLSSQPNITSIAVSDGKLWAGLFNGGVVEITQNGSRAVPVRSPEMPTSIGAGLPSSSPASVVAIGGRLVAMTEAGAFERERSSTGLSFTALTRTRSLAELSGRHITSVTVDGSGDLWVGYFDRGLDILSPESGERITHLEDESLREINSILVDEQDEQVLVGTSAGLVAIATSGKRTVFTKEKDGLVSDSVSHISIQKSPAHVASVDPDRIPAVAPLSTSLIIVTGGGLTEMSGGRTRSITAFHGLPSNHLYTSAVDGSRLFAGSLAGLVELEGLRVIRSYKTSNSSLSHDWVTALVNAEGTLYIGTNGGGVDALLPTGEWVSFASELGRFEVNQNAMYFDGERLYTGTTDRGMLVYNVAAQRWKRISDGLPSQNVTAIVSDDRFVYVATLNGLMRIEKRVLL